ncbi:septum formation initiator family protein [Pyruvatibacter sp.]|uniref:FtsB family cell division protein n=1 Tax=Pyruvatibacter sp. TaxID=1981328 RepID=UPI0032EAF3B0
MHNSIRTSQYGGRYSVERDGLRARLGRAILPVACLCIMGYFGWHAVHGDHGLLKLVEMREVRAGLEAQVASARDVRAGLERDVALLRPESLDPDLLDERARAALGFAHPDELTIFVDE